MPSVLYRVRRENAQALLIDTQEKLTPLIHENDKLVAKIAVLIQGLQALNVPITLNEQYKKGLGATVPTLYDLLNESNRQSFEKRSFSVRHNPPTWEHIKQQNRKVCILFGIETHICVLQSALDLLEEGFLPVVIADAVGSRNPKDGQYALKRLATAGVVLSSVESILFELCQDSQDPAFKAISKLVK